MSYIRETWSHLGAWGVKSELEGLTDSPQLDLSEFTGNMSERVKTNGLFTSTHADSPEVLLEQNLLCSSQAGEVLYSLLCLTVAGQKEFRMLLFGRFLALCNTQQHPTPQGGSVCQWNEVSRIVRALSSYRVFRKRREDRHKHRSRHPWSQIQLQIQFLSVAYFNIPNRGRESVLK